MFKAIKNYLWPLFRKRPCVCGDPLAAATVTVTVATDPPRPRPTRPPTCPVCEGRRTLLIKAGCVMGTPMFTLTPCRCCGGAGEIPRVVAERIRADPTTVRNYRDAFRMN